ncbi:hypothetical protein LTR86_001856 [Recurvomyces mirabilis]|nr:hypothetical protein LTR86_001856 [Recurvomyces mirabilis]
MEQTIRKLLRRMWRWRCEHQEDEEDQEDEEASDRELAAEPGSEDDEQIKSEETSEEEEEEEEEADREVKYRLGGSVGAGGWDEDDEESDGDASKPKAYIPDDADLENVGLWKEKMDDFQ